MYKTRLLAVLNNSWPPPVEVTGVSALYKTQLELAHRGHQVHILTSVGVWDKLSEPISIPSVPQTFLWIREQENKYGIFFHTYNLSILRRLPKIAFIINRILPVFIVPIIVLKHGISVVHEYSSMPALLWRSWFFKKILGVRVFHSLISEVPKTFWSARLLPLPRIDGVVSINQRIRDQIVRTGYPPERVHHISIGVDAEKFSRTPRRSDTKTKTFLFLAPLESHKGPDIFVRAAIIFLKKNPKAKVRFVIATYESPGDTPYSERKKEITDRIYLHKRHFQFLEGMHDVGKLMEESDAVVLPQRRLDGATGYPVTMLEAMAAKRLVGASNIAGINELISDGKNGLLFPVNDSEGLAGQMQKIVSGSVDTGSLTENAYRLVMSKHSVRSVAEEYERIYTLSDKQYLVNNRLLYYASLHNDRFQAERLVGDALLKKDKKTKDAIGDIARKFKLRYAIAKQNDRMPVIHSDIDLVIRENDADRWIELFKREGFSVRGHDEFLKKRQWQYTVERDGYTKIDLTIRFGWQNRQYFDDAFIWERAANGRLDKTADFAVTIGAILFKRLYITYAEYLSIKPLLTRKNHDEIRRQAQKFGWTDCFDVFWEYASGLSDVSDFPALLGICSVGRIMREQLRNGAFSLNYYLYFVLSRLRYAIDRRHLPYMVDWSSTTDKEI